MSDQGDSDARPRGEDRRAQPSSSTRDLDAIFGDVLPDITADESDEGATRDRAESGDSWYLENRPPHHDR